MINVIVIMKVVVFNKFKKLIKKMVHHKFLLLKVKLVINIKSFSLVPIVIGSITFELIIVICILCCCCACFLEVKEKCEDIAEEEENKRLARETAV